MKGIVYMMKVSCICNVYEMYM